MDTVNGVKDVIKEIMPYLEQAAEKLGTTAQYLWALQVKQGHILGWAYTIKTCIWIGCVALWFLLLWVTRKDDDFTGVHVFCFLVLVVLFVFWIPSIQEIATLFYNPEYWALNQVILLLKGSIK